MAEDTVAPPRESTDVESLKKKIVRQIEFYFGDYNLMKDKFMLQRMKENDGWFTMDLMLQFKRLASICSEPTVILEALVDADGSLLEIDHENQRIRRKTERVIPEDNEEFRTMFRARTVYVKGFQDDECIDDIQDFLSDYGKIDGIHLQRLSNRKFKGSLFVTFRRQEDAESFINAPMVYYKGITELSKMSRNKYYQELEDKKKEKKSGKQENKEQRPLVAIKVSGITDDTVTHRDIKEVFEAKGKKNILYFDRFEKLGHEGYLIFLSNDEPEILLKECEFEDAQSVAVKAASIAFSEPSEKEKNQILDLYAQAKQRFTDRPFKRNNRPTKRGPKKDRGVKTTFESDDDKEEHNGSEEPAVKAPKLD